MKTTSHIFTNLHKISIALDKTFFVRFKFVTKRAAQKLKKWSLSYSSFHDGYFFPQSHYEDCHNIQELRDVLNVHRSTI